MTITIHGERGDELERVLGKRTFPVKLPSLLADLPGLGEKRVYLLDLNAMEPAEVEKIVKHLANKFGLSIEEAAEELKEQGIPILDEDVTLRIENLRF